MNPKLDIVVRKYLAHLFPYDFECQKLLGKLAFSAIMQLWGWENSFLFQMRASLECVYHVRPPEVRKCKNLSGLQLSIDFFFCMI